MSAPASPPAEVTEEFEQLQAALRHTSWTLTLEDLAAHHRDRAANWVILATRRVPSGYAEMGEVSETSPTTPTEPNPAEPCDSGGNAAAPSLKPKSPMGGQTGLAEDLASVPTAAEAPNSLGFGELATVRAMGSGDSAPVVAVDTEFTYIDGEQQQVRVIDSYQFSAFDPFDARYRVDVAILPTSDGRVHLEDALAIVIRETGLWRKVGLSDWRGVPTRNFLAGKQYKASVDRLFKLARIEIVLAGHYLNADLTAFARPARQRGGGERYNDILRRVTSASGGLVGLNPVRMIAKFGSSGGSRWLPMSITVRDTMGQTAEDSKNLAALGSSCGVEKLEVCDWIDRMSEMRRALPIEFLEYGVNDAVIVLMFLTSVWGLDSVPPVTISGGGARALRDGIRRYWGMPESRALFQAKFQGLMSLTETEVDDSDGLSYYKARNLVPVDGDANQVHTACKHAYHGGWNSALRVGYFPGLTHDHDIQSAYPSAMAALVDIDFEAGCVEEVIKDRDLTVDDFPLGYITPLVVFASWWFPEGVEPCLPVRVDQCIIYPRTSDGIGAGMGEGVDSTTFDGFEGAWVMGPEILLALELGARVTAQIGYRMRVLMHNGGPSRSMRFALTQMVADRETAKTVWGAKSLEQATIKVAMCSCYGKLAQDVSERHGWDAWAEEMESVGGSSVTSPYHAAMLTSLVRALLLAMANELS